MTGSDFFRYLAYGLVLASPVIAGALIARIRRGEGTLSELEQRQFAVLKILVPKNNDKGPLSSEQMFNTLHGIFRKGLPAQEHVSFEIAADESAIQFFTFVPRHLVSYVESQVYAQYPHVEISEVDDYARVELGPEMKPAGADLNLIREEFFPIKTFPNFEVDPLAAVTGMMSNLAAGERLWVQFLVEPADEAWQKSAQQYVKAVKKGLLPKTSFNLNISPAKIGASALGIVTDVISTAVHGAPGKPAAPAAPPAPALSSFDEQGLKGIEAKINKLGYKTLIRIVGLAPEATRARTKVLEAVGAFKQFNVSNLNGFATPELILDRSVLDDYRRRAMRGGYVLNSEELASVFHLPHLSVETPAIAWAGSKKGEPPQNLPVEGSVAPEEITLFGLTNFRNKSHKFGIKMPDRRYHTYSIGKTGTGKSTLIENMALDDIYKGRGVAVFDPHGDLIKRIIDRIPSHRINDIVYFNPADREYPVAFNLLENVEQDLKGIVASGLMSIFTKLWSNVWSARMEYILRNTVLAALDYPDSTLLSVMKILNDPVYRKHVIAKIQDPVIKDFFLNEFEKYDPRFRQEAIAPIQNKVGQFLSSATMRNILGQPKSTIDFENIINTGKILLVNLSIGEIGEDASALLGGMLITKIQLSAMRRAVVPEEQRKDFYVYVDEFQNFATESFAVILSEARKYRLNLFLTNQFIAQMPEVVRDAVFGNVGTTISFRVGPQDASVLVKEFEPTFEATDLVNLDNYHIYLKMTIDGVTSVPFSAVTLPPAGALEEGNADKVIRVSREHYARSRDFVEKKITEWTEFWENIAREEAREAKERKFAAKGKPFRRDDRPPPRPEPPKEQGRVQPKEEPPAVKPAEPSAPPPKYIPPPPLRPLQPVEEKVEEHISPAIEPPKPLPAGPLVTPQELEHNKKEFSVPAFGSRSGDIVPLQEGEEIKLDE